MDTQLKQTVNRSSMKSSWTRKWESAGRDLGNSDKQREKVDSMQSQREVFGRFAKWYPKASQMMMFGTGFVGVCGAFWWMGHRERQRKTKAERWNEMDIGDRDDSLSPDRIRVQA